MSKHLKTLTFVNRQQIVPTCRWITLHTALGDVLGEYVNGSEQLLGVAEGQPKWQYGFWIDEEDLPGNLTEDQICNSILIEPYLSAAEKCCGGCNESSAAGGGGEEWNFLVDEPTTTVTARIEHWMHRIEEVQPTNFRAWIFEVGTEDLQVNLVEENTVVASVVIPAGSFNSGATAPTFNVQTFLPDAKMKVDILYPNGSGVTPPKGLEVALRGNFVT